MQEHNSEFIKNTTVENITDNGTSIEVKVTTNSDLKATPVEIKPEIEEPITIERALHYLGDCDNVRNPKLAFKMLDKLSAQGSPIADLKLGECFLRGIACPIDYQKAAGYFKLASDAGLVEGSYRYYECLSLEIGVKKNDFEKLKYLQLASDRGYAKANLELANLLIKDDFILKDELKALSLYQTAHNDGDCNATYALAHYYLYSKRDYENAINYLELAIKAQHLAAIYLYADCLYEGLGVSKDIQKAKSLYERLLTSGKSELTVLAYDKLAKIYFDESNIDKSIQYYCNAAKLGNCNSIYKLAVFIAEGKYMPQNAFYAAMLFQKAAAFGHIEAKLDFAECKLRGSGVLKNEKEAYQLANSLLSTNNLRAKFLVAMMLYTGKGVIKDESKGLCLLNDLARQNYDRAIKILERINHN